MKHTGNSLQSINMWDCEFQVRKLSILEDHLEIRQKKKTRGQRAESSFVYYYEPN